MYVFIKNNTIIASASTPEQCQAIVDTAVQEFETAWKEYNEVLRTMMIKLEDARNTAYMAATARGFQPHKAITYTFARSGKKQGVFANDVAHLNKLFKTAEALRAKFKTHCIHDINRSGNIVNINDTLL